MEKWILLLMLLPFPSQAESWVKVAELAKGVTVQVNPAEGYASPGGTGVIVARKGDTYFVLTNHHVACLRPADRSSCVVPSTIRTHRGETYPIIPKGITSFQRTAVDPDLALLEFSSPKSYPVAAMGDSNNLKPGVDVIVAGYPAVTDREKEQRQIRVTTGFIAAIEAGAQAGYALKYDAKTWWGNSGSPIFDGQGKLVGIHGQTEISYNPVAQNKTQTGINEGIPINIFRKNWRESPPVAATNYQVNMPDTPEGFYKRGIISYQNREYKIALENFNQALQLNPNYEDAFLFRGHTKYEQKDTKGAILDYDRFIQKNPQTARYRLKDRRTYFLRTPELIGAETTFLETGFPNPTYFYYIRVPDRIGIGIKTIEILQEEGGASIDYNLKQIEIKSPNNIPFTAELGENKLVITFPETIEASQDITIAISPYQNPDLSGTYQFRVTAFPPGKLPKGQFLGFARFNFNRPEP